MGARRKRRLVIMLRLNNFEKLYIVAFFKLSNCSYHFVVGLNRVSIVTLSLFFFYREDRRSEVIIDKSLLLNRWLVFRNSIFCAVFYYSIISRFGPSICSVESFFPATVFGMWWRIERLRKKRFVVKAFKFGLRITWKLVSQVYFKSLVRFTLDAKYYYYR